MQADAGRQALIFARARACRRLGPPGCRPAPSGPARIAQVPMRYMKFAPK